MKPHSKNTSSWITLYLISLLQSMLSAQTKHRNSEFGCFNEAGGHHIEYSKAARVGSTKLQQIIILQLIILTKTDPINDAYLSQYQLIIQLDYVPYAWTPAAVAAFEKYINEGKGGWIGFHHATLLGEFDGYKIWPWFSDFMGGIRYKNYIGDFASATVNVEDKNHPVMKGVPASFLVKKEEWYIYDKSSPA